MLVSCTRIFQKWLSESLLNTSHTCPVAVGEELALATHRSSHHFSRFGIAMQILSPEVLTGPLVSFQVPLYPWSSS